MSEKELKKSAVLIFLKILVFFSLVGDYIQTSADDVIISQLQAISQFFSSYPPSGGFCQVSELTVETKKWPPLEKCLFGQTWAKIFRRWASGHLQG